MEALVYYVYLIVDPRDSKIIYVGKGKGGRYLTHERIVKYNRKPINKKLNNKLKKIIGLGLHPIYEFKYCEISEEDAYRLENELTNKIGLNNLCNLKHGGTNGAKFSEETRIKMKISALKIDKSIFTNPIRCKKISDSKIGVPRSEETKVKIRNHHKEFLVGKTIIEIHGIEKAGEITQKIVQKNLGKKRTNEFKERQSKRFSGENNPMYGKKQTNEFKENRKAYFLGENNPGKHKTDETKRKISESKQGVPSKLKGKPVERIRCPHCNTIGGINIMKRWHFENCKNKNYEQE